MQVPADAQSEVVLDAVLGDHPITAAIKSGATPIPGARLQFHEYKPTNNAFAEMVNTQKFDICEMAIMTALLAHRYEKPIGLLPITVVSRFQQPYLVYRAGNGISKPEDLVGKKVGVRSYTVTTGAWIRGILEQDYGVAPASIEWVTFEPPHVAEYVNPSNVSRADSGETILDELTSGKVDAAVVGNVAKLPDGIQRLFPQGAEQEWFAKHGVIPINHLICVTDELSSQRPDIVRGFVETVAAEKAKLGPQNNGSFDPFPLGMSACRDSIELMIEFGLSQGILDRKIAVEELFAAPVRDWL